MSATILGIICIRYFNRNACHHLLRIPATFVAIFYTLDAGLAPIATSIFELGTSDPTVLLGRLADPSEYWATSGALALHFGNILCGLCIGWKRMLQRAIPMSSIDHYSEHVRLWKASLAIFLIGLTAYGLSVAILLQNNSLLSISSERALFTDEQAVSSAFFNTLLLLLPFMEVGIWGLLLFRSGRGPGQWTWMPAAILLIAFQVLIGGRSRTIFSVLMLLLLYHISVKKVRTTHAAVAGGAVLAGLVAISMLRFGASNALDGLRRTAEAFLYDRRFEQVAFALRSFPDDYDFFGGQTILPSLAFVIPGLKIKGINLYMYMMTEMIGPSFAERGYGGGNYASAAEHFMNFGWAGIAVIALLYGLFFGFLFGWCARWSGERLSSLVFIGFLAPFIGGLSSRLFVAWVSPFPSFVLPLALLLLFSFPKSRGAKRLLMAIGAAVVTYALSRDGNPLSKSVMILSIGLIYAQVAMILRGMHQRGSNGSV